MSRSSRVGSLLTTVALMSALLLKGAPVSAETMTLQGGVEHSDMLEPLNSFQLGEYLDERLLPSNQGCNGNWWPVPDWLAGSWHKKGTIETLEFIDLQTNKPIPCKKKIHVNYPDNEILGHQEDGAGQVWTFVPLPCVMRTSTVEHTNVNVYHSFDLVHSSEDYITVRLFLVTIMVSNETQKVVSICQRESLQTWKIVDDDTISIHDSVKFFDKDGRALATKKMLSYSKKFRDFCPVAYIDRVTHRPIRNKHLKVPDSLFGYGAIPLDLKNSLAEFLRSKNLTSSLSQ